MSLNDLETALQLVRSSAEAGSQGKWKIVGDKALEAWQMDLAQEAYEKAQDYPALLLLYTSLSDRSGLEKLASSANGKGLTNIAFAAYLQLGDASSCIDILSNTGRLPEAALFARTYAPEKAGEVVARWKQELETEGRGKVAATIADPREDGSSFPEMEGSTSASAAETTGYQVPSTEAQEEEGSGVMVEKPEEDTEMGEAAEGEDSVEKTGLKEKVKHVLEEKVKEPVEGLVDKVKDLAVGGESLRLS